jgi:hypothetical protein
MIDFDGGSATSSLAREDGGQCSYVSGFSCRCGKWIEKEIIPVCQIPKGFMKTNRGNNGGKKGLTSKQYGAAVRQGLEARFDEILAMQPINLRNVVKELGIDMTYPTFANHFRRIVREKGIEVVYAKSNGKPIDKLKVDLCDQKER